MIVWTQTVSSLFQPEIVIPPKYLVRHQSVLVHGFHIIIVLRIKSTHAFRSFFGRSLRHCSGCMLEEKEARSVCVYSELNKHPVRQGGAIITRDTYTLSSLRNG